MKLIKNSIYLSNRERPTEVWENRGMKIERIIIEDNFLFIVIPNIGKSYY